MADLSTYTDTNDDTDVGPDRRATTGTSRWQIVVGIIGIVVALWVGNQMVNIIFADGGQSPAQAGPEQHTGGGNTHADPTGTSSALTDAGSTPSSTPLVSIRGTEYSFDAPDTIPAVPITLRFTNEGRENPDLHLVRLDDGVLIHQFQQSLHQDGVDAALRLTSMEGSVGAIGPAQTADVTVGLPEGEYVLICLVTSPSDGVAHALKGMAQPLTVPGTP